MTRASWVWLPYQGPSTLGRGGGFRMYCRSHDLMLLEYLLHTLKQINETMVSTFGKKWPLFHEAWAENHHYNWMVFLHLSVHQSGHFQKCHTWLNFEKFHDSIIHKLHVVMSLIHTASILEHKLNYIIWYDGEVCLLLLSDVECHVFGTAKNILKTQYPVKHSSSCRKTAMSDSTSCSTNVEYLLNNVHNPSVHTCTLHQYVMLSLYSRWLPRSQMCSVDTCTPLHTHTSMCHPTGCLLLFTKSQHTYRTVRYLHSLHSNNLYRKLELGKTKQQLYLP